MVACCSEGELKSNWANLWEELDRWGDCYCQGYRLGTEDRVQLQEEKVEEEAAAHHCLPA